MDRLIRTPNKESLEPQQSSHPQHCNYFPLIHHWNPRSRTLLTKNLTPSSLIQFLRKVERRRVKRQSQQAIPQLPIIIPITETTMRQPQPSAFQMDPWKKSLPIWTCLSLVKYTILNTLYMIKTLTSKQHMAHEKTFIPSPSISCCTSISLVQPFSSRILHRCRSVESCIRIFPPASLLLLL